MKKSMDSLYFLFLLLCIFICTIIILPCRVFSKSSAHSVIAGINYINISEKEIESENKIIKIHLKIPVISGLSNKDAEAKINNTLLNDALRFRMSREKEAEDAYEASKMNGIKYNKYEADATYTVKYNKNNILSIPVVYYQYTGGAHGISTQAGYNFDLNTGRLLQLSDLFPKGFDYKKVIDSIILNDMKAHKDIYFSQAINSFQGIDGMHPYYIQDGYLVIFFSEYEIAPYAAGTREFKIPYSKLKFIPNIGLK